MSIRIPRARHLGLAIALALSGVAQALDHGALQIPAVSDAAVELLAQQRIKLGEPDAAELRTRLRDELKIQRLLAQEAAGKGLERSSDVRAQIELSQLAVLSKAYLDDYFGAHPVTDEALEHAYEKQREAGEIVEYRVRHLSVTREEDARELLKQVQEGADLAELAREHSTDPAASTGSGDIGWFRPDIFVDRNFADAVSGLEKGETVEAPVKTRFGWHVIRVEDGPRPVADLPPFAEIKPEIRKIMREKAMRKALDRHIAELKQAEVLAQGAGAERLSQLP